MYLEKLEFNKILEMLRNLCITEQGKELAIQLFPSNEKGTVKQLLQETKEATTLCLRNGTPCFDAIADISVSLKVLESNHSLSAKALLSLANIFKLAKDLKNYFDKDFLDLNEYPILADLFSKLYTNQSVVDKIFACILEDFSIDDKASKTLQLLRKQKRMLEQDIRASLNDMLHSSFSKYMQESIITVRNDRFVIPVKQEYRSKIKGFVHDSSNAGSTLFIEPLSIFEKNNELSRLKFDEELEIERILLDLTSLFYPYIEELSLDVTIISKLDFIFAKAKFSKSLNAIIPIINDKKEIHLKKARHPLIDSKKMVPISLDLGDNFSQLVITGPNTGGKTVTLKTVGLLICMACSGLAIPCSENSSIFVFDMIFADIGDDQSIEGNLSTFSSHILNIAQITKNATNHSLILVDELGSGTDPLEGSYLAISILDYFKSLGCLTIATTHYQELKKYALVTDGFQNASVEFDVSTLSPTYQLLVGIPGKSNAFEISKKLGLNENIIAKAQSLMTDSEIDIENLLKNIYDQTSLLEKQKAEIAEELERAKILRQSLEEENTDVQKQQSEIINKAKQNARDILLDAKEEATHIIKQMHSTKDTSTLENARNSLNVKIKDIHLQETNSSRQDAKNSLSVEDIKPNVEVFVINLGQNGKVLSYPSKSCEVQVQVGNLKLNVPIKYLSAPNHVTKNDKLSSTVNNSSNYSIAKTKSIKTEVNVIGLNIEEAKFVVDKFLDDCSLAHLNSVRIVHGKGTGKLRNRYS